MPASCGRATSPSTSAPTSATARPPSAGSARASSRSSRSPDRPTSSPASSPTTQPSLVRAVRRATGDDAPAHQLAQPDRLHRIRRIRRRRRGRRWLGGAGLGPRLRSADDDARRVDRRVRPSRLPQDRRRGLRGGGAGRSRRRRARALVRVHHDPAEGRTRRSRQTCRARPVQVQLGARLLFLHGAGFTGKWLPFHEALARGADLIAPEHPGYGETEMPDWLDGFDDLVLHYDELLDALGLDGVTWSATRSAGGSRPSTRSSIPSGLRSLTLITPAGLRARQADPAPLRDVSRSSSSTASSTTRPTSPRSRRTWRDFDEIVTSYGRGATLRGSPGIAVRPRSSSAASPRDVSVAGRRAEHDRLIPDEMAERYAELLPRSRSRRSPARGTRSSSSSRRPARDRHPSLQERVG